MAVTQSKKSSANGVTSLAVSFDSLPAVGARVAVAIACWPAAEGDNLTCTDNQSHTYSSRWSVQGVSNTNGYALFDVVVTTSSGTFTVTAGGLGTSGDITVHIIELSGAGQFEESLNDTTNQNAVTVTKALTTDGANRELLGVLTTGWGADPANVTENNGFTLVQENTNNASAAALYTAYKSVASAGTETASWTWGDTSAHDGMAGVAAYYAAGGVTLQDRHAGRGIERGIARGIA